MLCALGDDFFKFVSTEKAIGRKIPARPISRSMPTLMRLASKQHSYTTSRPHDRTIYRRGMHDACTKQCSSPALCSEHTTTSSADAAKSACATCVNIRIFRGECLNIYDVGSIPTCTVKMFNDYFVTEELHIPCSTYFMTKVGAKEVCWRAAHTPCHNTNGPCWFAGWFRTRFSTLVHCCTI